MSRDRTSLICVVFFVGFCSIFSQTFYILNQNSSKKDKVKNLNHPHKLEHSLQTDSLNGTINVTKNTTNLLKNRNRST